METGSSVPLCARVCHRSFHSDQTFEGASSPFSVAL